MSRFIMRYTSTSESNSFNLSSRYDGNGLSYTSGSWFKDSHPHKLDYWAYVLYKDATLSGSAASG